MHKPEDDEATPKTRVRLEEVAKLAGVSPKTASRVLNNEAYVQTQTRERVLEAVKALGYQPNLSARSLASNRSFLIALLYDNASPSYTMEVQNGVLEACDANQYSMMMQPMDSASAKFVERVEDLISLRRIDGLVLTPPIADHAKLLARLKQRNIPFSCVSPRNQKGPGAAMDEVGAARDMVRFLFAKGHRRIAHIKGPSDHGGGAWRLEGYRQALDECGIKFSAPLVVEGNFLFDSGVAAARKLFRLKNRPTAIFAANDDMAAGVIWAAQEAKIAVPEALSICGFDDTPLAVQLWPPVTTVHQPCRDLGRIACLQLFERIRSGKGQLVQVPHWMCVRESVARIA